MISLEFEELTDRLVAQAMQGQPIEKKDLVKAKKLLKNHADELAKMTPFQKFIHTTEEMLMNNLELEIYKELKKKNL